ncbi:MAG: EAL domain-containing protein [Firmicutes bacterium]|nr:EAL domain-containing protein [Bacillota bacterium]
MFKTITNKLFGSLKKNRNQYEGLLAKSMVPWILHDGHWVAMLYLDIMDFKYTERIYGNTFYIKVLQNLNRLISSLTPEYIKPYKFIESIAWGDDTIILFYSPELPPPNVTEMSALINQVCQNLSAKLNEDSRHLIPIPINLQPGYSLICPGFDNIEKLFYEKLKEAMLVAKSGLDPGEYERRQHFGRVLLEKDVRMVYQPIVSLNDGSIIGYEALARGPENSFFHNPVNLFEYARKTCQLYALEKITRESAMSAFTKSSFNEKLFINITPEVIDDPAFRADELILYLAEMNAVPQQVVFEITERTSINDFRFFREGLKYYRHFGFQIAIDDAGSGYSSLQAISELQPEYIKLDISLIRDIDKTPNKRSLVETFLTFSEKTGSKIIAEGIETTDELICLRKIGIPIGQGFLLARPSSTFPEVNKNAINKLLHITGESNHLDHIGRLIPVGSISQSFSVFNPCTITRDVMEYFTSNPQVEGIAVVDGQLPVGLVMRDKLSNQLATQFGFSIYNDRPVSLVMDSHPLIVEDEKPVEVVSQIALNRPSDKVYDSIITIKNGNYAGLVSLRSLLDTITAMQMDAARYANPLTGLPGNRLIEEELLKRLESQRPFSVIYTDLDNFKGFNDYYGLQRGDLVIKLTADVLRERLNRKNATESLVGHVGGDDFIIITGIDETDSVCRDIISAFDERVRGYYDQNDLARGYINTKDRQDQDICLPVMSISLTLIDCLPGQYRDINEISREAAELKKYAKSLAGSIYVRNRRRKNKKSAS